MRNTALLSLLLAFACSDGDKAPAKPAEKPAAQEPPAREPDYVTVDHILVGIKGPGRNAGFPHSAADAKVLAYDLLEQLEAGADWDALKRQHSDDPPPGGPYSMSNDGVTPRPNDIPRGGMVKAFGNVGFALKVGEIRMADHGPDSPFGYHIIKRVK